VTVTEWLARKGESDTGMAADALLRGTATGNYPYQELKSTIHRRLIDRLDLSTVADLTPEQLSGIIKTVVENMIAQEGIPLSRPERDRLVVEIQNETMGLGPLEPLLSDTEISDIMVNGPHGVFVERHGKIEKTDVCFKDNEHLMAVIERIVSKVAGYRFKPIGRLDRRPSATNVESILRGDEEDACVHKLGDRPLPRKASVELTARALQPRNSSIAI
jgi:pilus assembly protein CpaF